MLSRQCSSEGRDKALAEEGYMATQTAASAVCIWAWAPVASVGILSDKEVFGT